MMACHNSLATSKEKGNVEDRSIVQCAQTPCALHVIEAEVRDSWVSMIDVGTDPCPVHSTPCILHLKAKSEAGSPGCHVEFNRETSLSKVWAYV